MRQKDVAIEETVEDELKVDEMIIKEGVYTAFCPLQVTDGFNSKPSRLSLLRWRVMNILGFRENEDW